MFLPEAGPWLPLLDAVRKLLMVIAAVDQDQQMMTLEPNTAAGEEPGQQRQTLERRLGPES